MKSYEYRTIIENNIVSFNSSINRVGEFGFELVHFVKCGKDYVGILKKETQRKRIKMR